MDIAKLLSRYVCTIYIVTILIFIVSVMEVKYEHFQLYVST